MSKMSKMSIHTHRESCASWQEASVAEGFMADGAIWYN